MGFLARSRDKFRLRGALKRLKKKPTPQVLCEIIQCHVQLDDLDAAYQYSSWGLKRFPSSALVREMHRIVVQDRAHVGLEKAQEDVETDPGPDAYLRLAKFALQVRDTAKAIAALEECLEDFPDHLGVIQALSDLKERRYLRDLNAVDGLTVVELLMKGSQQDPNSADWHIRLSRFYRRVAAFGLARSEVDAALAKDPSSQPAKDALAQLPANPNVDDDNLASILSTIEEQGFLPNCGEEAIRLQRELERLRQGLPVLNKHVKAHRSLVLVRNDEAYDAEGAVGMGSFVSLANNLLRSTHVTVRRVGLGPLRGATLETSGGAVVLRRGYRSTVACLLPKDTSIRGSQEALGHLLTASASAAEADEKE